MKQFQPEWNTHALSPTSCVPCFQCAFYLSCLGIKPKASHMPGKHCINWLMPLIDLSFMRENTAPLDFCVYFIPKNSVLSYSELISVRYIFRSSITESYDPSIKIWKNHHTVIYNCCTNSPAHQLLRSLQSGLGAYNPCCSFMRDWPFPAPWWCTQEMNHPGAEEAAAFHQPLRCRLVCETQ